MFMEFTGVIWIDHQTAFGGAEHFFFVVLVQTRLWKAYGELVEIRQEKNWLDYSVRFSFLGKSNGNAL